MATFLFLQTVVSAILELLYDPGIVDYLEHLASKHKSRKKGSPQKNQ